VAGGGREREDGGRRRRGDKEGEKENDKKYIYISDVECHIKVWGFGCGELVVSVATLNYVPLQSMRWKEVRWQLCATCVFLTHPMLPLKKKKKKPHIPCIYVHIYI
jgi:hypothetical protein